MKRFLVYLMITVLLLGMTQAFTFSSAYAANTVSIGEADNGKTIYLMKGDVLQLSLTANPSTGYVWQYVQQPNSAVLTQTDHYLKTLSPAPGSPSTETWVYSATGAGNTVISLKWFRPWETTKPPLKTYQINVVVR